MKGGNFCYGLPALWLIGCGGAATLSQQQLTASEGAIRAAEERGAQDVPKAALHLKMARDQVAAAHALAKKGEGDEAQLMLKRAEMDADLALAIAHDTEAHQDVEEVKRKVDALEKGERL